VSLRREINFEFDFEKFVNLVVYLAKQASDFDILKATKLLYFIDKHHLIRYGRPITGDVYYQLDYGPVPSLSYDLLKQMDDDVPVDISASPDKQRLLESLEVDEAQRYPIYRAKKEPDLNCFSRVELDSIRCVVKELGDYSSVDLMNLSHKDATYRKTRPKSRIDYRLFFEDNPDASHDALEAMEIEQDDRDFAGGLTGDRYSH
jgi:uncharacterized phage-associated protein